MDTITFGNTIRKWRVKRGWSMEALARLTRVNRSTLSRWEAGKTIPRQQELSAVLVALGIPTREVSLLHETRETFPLVASGDAPPVCGDLLRMLRLRRGWTQQETCRVAGLRQGTLSKWEHSEDWPTNERLHALCFALGATPEETAMLTRGRFVPSLLSQTSTDNEAMELLAERKRALDNDAWYGRYAWAEFGLLQVEADAWRLAQRTNGVASFLLHTVEAQVMLHAMRSAPPSQLTSISRRGAYYTRALNQENHPLLLTQRIIRLQTRGKEARQQRNVSQMEAIAQAYLALLPRTSWSFGAEYRSWLYLEAAENLSGIPNQDVSCIQRLVDAAFAEPKANGENRGEDATALRYAATIYGQAGFQQQAMTLAQKSMNSDLNTFYAYLTMARLATYTQNDNGVSEYLSAATSQMSELPQHENLPSVLRNVSDELLQSHQE